MPVAECTVKILNWRQRLCTIEAVEADGIPYYLVDNDPTISSGTASTATMTTGSGFRSSAGAVLEMLEPLDFIPDIMHMNDWHTGMVSVAVSAMSIIYRPGFGHIKTLFTIHNLKYQGNFPPGILPDLLNLSMDYFNSGELEFHWRCKLHESGHPVSPIM
ncbi:MAG: glycogen/starch synthase [Candidatus Moduliflexus flocculans]|nr:glycogen/starch synthase [Candidatus Moduliflexus flocculans]